MNYSLSVTQNDVYDMHCEKKMHFNVKNVHSCIENRLEKDALGFFNEKFKHASNYSIVERNSLFTSDVRIKESTSIPLFSLYFILNGTNGYQFTNNDTVIRYGTNNIWSFAPEEERCIISRKNEKSSSIGILFHKTYIEELVNRYPQLLEHFYCRHKNGESFRVNKQCHMTTPEMYQVISQIKNASLMGQASEIYTEAKILELLALQIDSRGNNHDSKPCNHCKTIDDVEKIKEAKHILVNNLNEPPSILDLSRQVGINENKLKYGFKELFNHTIYGYLFDFKMNRASSLLLDSNKTILDIAFECGYGDASHFTKAFKRKHGVSPRVFRNKNK